MDVRCFRLQVGSKSIKIQNIKKIVLITSMKEPQQGTQDIGLEEQNYILKAWKDLKDSIFNVLYVLLDKDDDQEQQQPMFGLIFESGLDYFQMLAFPFDESIMSAWNGGDTLTSISSIFSKLNIMTYLPGVSFDTFLVMLYALILLIILVLIDIIYVSYSFSKKRFRFTWPLVILAKLVPLFVTIFFLPITETLLSVVRCVDGVNDYQVMQNFPDVVCWKGWHLFHASITLLFTSLFVFISSIVALALFEPRMVSKKLTARQNSTGQVVFIMNKIICQLIFSFTPFKEKWVYSVMLFGLSGWLYWTYNMKDPFYNKKASKFFIIVSSYYFWTNTMLLLSQLLGPIGFNGGLVIWISGLPFIGIIIGFEHKSNIDQLFSFNLKFKSGEQLEGHLRYVLQLLQSQEQDKNSYMLVTGYIEKHKQICIEDDCPLKITKKLTKASTDKEDLNAKFLLQIERMYKLGIKKYPNCTRLRLSFAFFQLERLKNKNKAYQQFSFALKTDPSFEEEFIIYRFKKIIRENLENAEGSEETTDLIELIRFQNHISLCEEAMINSARFHKDFWTEMKQQAPDLKKLNAIGTKITKSANLVKENYEEIAKINSSVPQVLYCFSMYLIMVIKDSIQGKKMLDLAKKTYLEKVNGSNKRKQSTENELSGEQINLPMMLISCKQGSFGKVINLNSLFTELCGYQREQIVERSFQKILPEVLKDTHEQKMKEWLQLDEQTSSYVNQSRQGYIKLKSGFILPVEYEVKCKSSAQSFTVIFQNSATYRNCCHLILDINKVIKDTSILGHFYFGLDRWTLSENEISFQDFFGVENFYDLVQQNRQKNFDYELTFRSKKISCSLNLAQIRMNFHEKVNNEPGAEKSEEAFVSNRLLGYYVRVVLLNADKFEMQSQIRQQEDSCQNLNELESSQDIMQLYEDPDLYDILISKIADTKSKTTIIQKFTLKCKIKTMRLLNNELKMVYDQNNNADFDNNDRDEDEEDDLQIMKLNDDRYQEKIRSAINTKLEHEEVVHLKYIGVAIGLLFVGVATAQMLFNLSVLQSYYDKSQFLQNITNETNELSKHLTATLDSTTNFTDMSLHIQNHQVNQAELNVTIRLGTGRTENMSIRDAFLYFYSKIAEFYKVSGQLNIDILYSNYILNMLPVIEKMNYIETFAIQIMRILLFVSFLLALLLSLVFLSSWVYTRLKIDKKKADILLWFLDIPIPYVSYLGENCDNYLKTFISIKEVMDKGIKIEDYPNLQDYKQFKEKQEQLEEQQKARKTLILKERKLTYCSRLRFSHCKMGWVLIFGLIYTVVGLFQFQALSSYDSFLKDQWVFSGRNIIWANSIHLSDYLIANGKQNLDGINIHEFKYKNQKSFERALSQTSLNTFNSEILLKTSNPDYSQAIESYTKVYFNDICAYLGISGGECSVISGSALRGGFRVYSMHIKNQGITKMSDIRIANEKYASRAILSMMNIWRLKMKDQVDKAVNLISIMFYVYVFGGMIFFCIGWLIYLGKLNNQMNEAIRMLNMIPFKLLSSSRKETRNFIAWIIKEANKKKHEIQ